MEIRRVLRGENTSFTPARPAEGRGNKTAGADRPATDRVELSRQWVEAMDEQRARAEAALLTGKKEKKTASILDMLDGAGGESGELEAEAQEMKTKMKCLEIAARMMRGKRIPPKDEQYLMIHDPKGYQIALALRKPPKKDEKECKSVLEDEEQGTGETSEAEATVEDGGEASSGGDAASSGSEGE